MIHFYPVRKIVCYFICAQLTRAKTSFRNKFLWTLRKTNAHCPPPKLFLLHNKRMINIQREANRRTNSIIRNIISHIVYFEQQTRHTPYKRQGNFDVELVTRWYFKRIDRTCKYTRGPISASADWISPFAKAKYANR